jgi:hypothetical protein
MNEDEWTNVKTTYPKHRQEIVVKIWDRKTKTYFELDAIFNDSELYRSWEIKPPEGTDIVMLPQWWKVKYKAGK